MTPHLTDHGDCNCRYDKEQLENQARAIVNKACEESNAQRKNDLIDRLLIIGIVVILIAMAWITFGWAQEIPAPAVLADAIYLAEGGAKTKHPYGILAKYKHTTPRQACINTINHAIRDWNGEGDFIEFLGNRYCPVGAKNDPTGLNKNWVRNVKYFLKRAR